MNYLTIRKGRITWLLKIAIYMIPITLPDKDYAILPFHVPSSRGRISLSAEKEIWEMMEPQ